jgi:hypothetical protein
MGLLLRIDYAFFAEAATFATEYERFEGVRNRE